MDFPDKITIGEKYGPAMAITDEAQAQEYFRACVEHNMRFGSTREQAEKIERANLGYYAGYYDAETAQRVYRLFNCAHPIFGRTLPTAEEAFKAGTRMGTLDRIASVRPHPDQPQEAV